LEIVSKFIGTNRTLPDIAPIPDDYDHTPQGAWSAPCHYCNLPVGATNFTMADCPGFCVVKSIFNYTNYLIKEQANPTMCLFGEGIEPCPLIFVVHYVGDVHQPLHVGYGYDEGGNLVNVTWYGNDTNLHHVWDSNMIDMWDSVWMNGTNLLEEMMQELNESMLVKEYISVTNPIDWADESFHYVLTTVYNFTDSAIAVPTHNHKASKSKIDSKRIMRQGGLRNVRVTEPHEEIPLGSAYYQRNIKVVKQRLIAAGVRLATLLNNVLTGIPA